ncbi:hypothetical protein C4577_01435 [Candidatus Parcubacteria bacterium]|nr:MAG: hypothetical protein C4577_01435 [Candidatus Parcubacteria bacterium]
MVVKTEILENGAGQEERSGITHLAFLVSKKSTGSNLQAAVDAINNQIINCQVDLVIGEELDIKASDVVRRNNLPLEVKSLLDRKSQTERKAYGKELAELLNSRGIQIAILEGFSIILSREYFETFKGATLNIHPGLIPDEDGKPILFPDGTEAPWNKGLMTDKAVANFLPLKYAGSTWHIVTEEADFGPVLKRVIVDVLPEDTVETLYPRLKRAEHQGLIGILKNPQEIIEYNQK